MSTEPHIPIRRSLYRSNTTPGSARATSSPRLESTFPVHLSPRPRTNRASSLPSIAEDNFPTPWVMPAPPPPPPSLASSVAPSIFSYPAFENEYESDSASQHSNQFQQFESDSESLRSHQFQQYESDSASLSSNRAQHDEDEYQTQSQHHQDEYHTQLQHHHHEPARPAVAARPSSGVVFPPRTDSLNASPLGCNDCNNSNNRACINAERLERENHRLWQRVSDLEAALSEAIEDRHVELYHLEGIRRMRERDAVWITVVERDADDHMDVGDDRVESFVAPGWVQGTGPLRKRGLRAKVAKKYRKFARRLLGSLNL
ncbi:hypothetical protein DFH27DRAFT_524291 [Peziza echinospora]|nr:hypothetical protein DFH27DRAFT_524291 [Peziza echinospora]